jgi:HEAT repeat protein
MNKHFVILTISLCALFIILNNYAIAQPTQEQQLTQEQTEAFRSAKTVKIMVEQSYKYLGVKKIESISLPFKDDAEEFLMLFTKLKVSESDVKNYDLEIKIEAEGMALSAMYSGSFGGTFYTGASVGGSISFEMPGVPIYKKPFKRTRKPPPTVGILKGLTDSYRKELKNPYNAPFLWPYGKGEGSYKRRLLEMIGEIFGLNCFIDIMKDQDSPYRYQASQTIKRIGDSRLVEPLCAAMKNNDSFLRREIAEILGKIKDPRAVKPLIAALKHENWEYRLYAAEALGKIGDPRALEALIAALQDENDFVRGDSAGALGDIGDSRAVEDLIVALKDKSFRVQCDAAEALGKIGEPQAVESLIAALKDGNPPGVREHAAEALGKIGEPQAVESLIAALKDGNPGGVRKHAAKALGKITGQRFYNLQRWQKWWEENKEKYLKKK